MADKGDYTLVIAAFDDPSAADEALDALQEFDKAGTIAVLAATAVSRDADGAVNVREVGATRPAWARPPGSWWERCSA
jgi:uncharacterized membrane protein